MCGLAGVAGEINHQEKQMFKELFFMATMRGTDGCGVASSDRNDNVRLCRSTETPFEMINYSKKFDKTIDPTMVDLIIGHTRSRTIGDVKDRNCHPFVLPEIVGCHNGTIDYQDYQKLPHKEDCETDSEALLWEISDKGVDRVIPTVSGAWALVWWHKKTRTLHFIRNEKRPLFVAFGKDRKTVFWASNSGWLKAVFESNLDRSGTQKLEECYLLDVDEHWRIQIGKGVNETLKPHRIGGKLCGKPHFTVTRTHYPHGSDSTVINEKFRYEINGVPQKYIAGVTQWDIGKSAFIWVKPEEHTIGSAVQKMLSPVFDKDEMPDDPLTDLDNVASPVSVEATRRVLQQHAINGLSCTSEQLNEQDIDRQWTGQKYLVGKRNKYKSFRGYKGKCLSEYEFYEHTKHGCSWCTRKPRWGQLVRFYTPTVFMCSDHLDATFEFNEYNPKPVTVMYNRKEA